ncbi:MAG: aminotransferase class V-fold PLP-dependent enzyme [Methanothrix sp.]|nr:aminotransferase class V-fold PLP-dependent enzyme [Methanothrix sp.]
MDTAFAEFNRIQPEYETTHILDKLREIEYGRLDWQDQIYLDYTGGGLYADSQLQKHVNLLRCNVFGNPHSQNPTSSAMTHLVERARKCVFRFFRASPDEYVVIFTPNATGGLKLVGEAYPFTPGDHFLLTADNHNSVNGIRVFAGKKGAKVTYLPVRLQDLRVDEDELERLLDQARPDGHNLFAYPAQSNFSGVQHPLDWIDRAHDKGWNVLLDCAAFVPTNRLDLSKCHPDFVPISFYKIFGYPTGIGCLLARKDALNKLQRPWFAGGTIAIVSTQDEKWYCLHKGKDVYEAFEDGTVNYLNIPAVEIGLRHIDRIGMETIHERVRCLTGWLLGNMHAIKHRNGRHIVKIYGPRGTEKRGGTIAFNLSDAKGRSFDCGWVQDLASKAKISLRTGCFCNPGDGEVSHNITRERMAECFEGNNRNQEGTCKLIRDKEMASIRISVGLVSNFPDVYRFMCFVNDFRDKVAEQIPRVDISRVLRDRGP